jgi:hypothetical protein
MFFGLQDTHPSSSSFIRPPATGHHRWSGAKGIYHFFTENNYFTITLNKKLWRDVAGSAALPAGGPLTVAGAFLE